MGQDHYDMAEKIKQLASFLLYQPDNKTSVAITITNVQQSIKDGDLEEATQQIIEANRLDKNFENDLPRITAIAIFEILGPKHELTKEYRRLFDMVLY